jgi:hypothetical protein
MKKEVSKKPFGEVEIIDLSDKNETPTIEQGIEFIEEKPVEPIQKAQKNTNLEIQEEPEELETESEDAENDNADQSNQPEEPVEEDDIDPYLYLGKILQEDGGLDSDFELKKGLNLKDLGQAVYSKLKKEYEPRVLEALQVELADQGYSAKELEIAKLMRSGVDVNMLQNKLLVYDRLSVYDKDANDDSKILPIKAVFHERGYSPDDIENLIDKIKEKGEVDTKYKEATAFFGEKRDAFLAEQNELDAKRKKLEKEQIEKAQSLIKSKLSSGEILGEKIDREIAKEIEDAIFMQTETVEVGGQKYIASKFQLFINEFLNDFEMQVSAYKKIKYKDKDIESIKKEIKKETEKDFIDAYKKSVQKSKFSKGQKNNQVKSYLDKEYSSMGRVINV